MKAIILKENGGPEGLALETRDSLKPGAGEIVVANVFAGLNFIDIYQRRGLYPVTLPAVLGGEGDDTLTGNLVSLTTLDGGDGNDRIFPLTPNAFRLAWERVKKRTEIDDLHFHDLRHEAVSRLFEQGLGIAHVAAISGHRDFRMLARYAHVRHSIA